MIALTRQHLQCISLAQEEPANLLSSNSPSMLFHTKINVPKITFLKVSRELRFLSCFVKNAEVRPSLSYKIILEQRQERDQLNS